LLKGEALAMRRSGIVALLALALGVTSCAYYDDYAYGGGRFGDYRYDGMAYDPSRWDEAAMRLQGPGAGMLDPWLALTSEGRDILAAGFGARGNGFVSAETADRANIWFRRYADSNRDMRLTDAEIRTALAHSAVEAR
jgi:hypothetical protein